MVTSPAVHAGTGCSSSTDTGMLRRYGADEEVTMDTFGMVVMLVGLLSVLWSLVWGDGWEREERRPDGAIVKAARPVFANSRYDARS